MSEIRHSRERWAQITLLTRRLRNLVQATSRIDTITHRPYDLSLQVDRDLMALERDIHEETARLTIEQLKVDVREMERKANRPTILSAGTRRTHGEPR